MLFLQGFDQLRVEGLLCDVTLVPGDGDEVFPVHRAMMASASDYFKAMFTGGVFVEIMHTTISKLLFLDTQTHVVCESAQDCKQLCSCTLSTVAYGFSN